jgi:hypothetical protein
VNGVAGMVCGRRTIVPVLTAMAKCLPGGKKRINESRVVVILCCGREGYFAICRGPCRTLSFFEDRLI